MVMMSIFFTAFFSGTSVIWDREFGFLKETLVAPASRKAVIFGRVLGDSLVALLQGLATFAVASLLVGRVNWLGLPVLLASMMLTALVYASLGSAIGSLVRNVETFQLIHVTVAMPMMFLSGAVVPIHMAPAWMRMAALAIPLTYGVDAARSATCGLSILPAWLDLGILAGLTSALFPLSAKAFERSTVA
ncbi:ABC transporter [Candidatus Bathyarchaeota archaeon]|nr:MAG: ABC transporter [Candidatus Bathyarchaeota archaeon]